MRFIGAGFLLISGWLLRGVLLSCGRARIRALRELGESFSLLACEIEQKLTPLLSLLHNKQKSALAEALFYRTLQGLSEEETENFAAVWQKACAELPLRETERDKIAALGFCLTGSEKQACDALSRTAQTLFSEAERQEAERRERERLITALCFAAGLLPAILLL